MTTTFGILICCLINLSICWLCYDTMTSDDPKITAPIRNMAGLAALSNLLIFVFNLCLFVLSIME